jgi:predicted lipoprotein
MIAKKTTSKSTVTLVHVDLDGQKHELTIKVGPSERKFVTENIEKIRYDKYSDVIKYVENKHNTTLQQALYRNANGKKAKIIRKKDPSDYRVATFEVF